MSTPRSLGPLLLILCPLILLPGGQSEAAATLDITAAESLQLEEFEIDNSMHGYWCTSQDVTPIADSRATGGVAVRIDQPCRLRVSDVTTMAWGVPIGIRARAENAEPAQLVAVYFDGFGAGLAEAVTQEYQTIALTRSSVIPPAENHDILLRTFGVNDGAIIIDEILFNFHGDDGCTNTPPAWSVAANGMGDGFAVWPSYVYAMKVENLDVEGDALSLATITEGIVVNDMTLEGVMATTKGPNVVLFQVTESNARCPDGPTYPVATAEVPFHGVKEFKPFVNLWWGEICRGETRVWEPTPIDTTMIVGSCQLGATLSYWAADDIPFIGATTFLLDGVPFGAGNGTGPRANLIVEDFGRSFVGVCTEAVGDVHERSFCGEGRSFLGVPGPTL